MQKAFTEVCKSLQLINRHDPLTAVVARHVIDEDGTGEREPEKIRDNVLAKLKDLSNEPGGEI